jgi:hypothetical protein
VREVAWQSLLRHPVVHPKDPGSNPREILRNKENPINISDEMWY